MNCSDDPLDSVIDDIHATRRRIVEKFGGDVHATTRDARRRQEASEKSAVCHDRESAEAESSGNTTAAPAPKSTSAVA